MTHSRFGKGLFPASSAFLLELPFRKLIKSPNLVADRLELQPHHHVLEVGAGGGYYSMNVAHRLSEGELVVQDIQLSMLMRLTLRANMKGRTNIKAVISDACSLPLCDQLFDRVYMITVLGEVSDPQAALREAFRVLKPSGILSVSEQRTDPDFLSSRLVDGIATDAGFVNIKRHGWHWNYTTNYTKADSA